MISDFCSDIFWDENATWNSDVPDFSTCFQNTLLVFIPCLVFSIIGIFNLYFLSGNIPGNTLPCTVQIILKQLLGVVLCVISITWCIMHFLEESDCEKRDISTLLALFSRPITYVIIIILMVKHRNHGVSTSAVLALFWVCFAVTGAVIHRSVILKYEIQNISSDWYFILCNVYYSLIYIELILSFFADKRPFDRLEMGSPLEEEAFFSGVTYLWFNRIVYRSIKRLLTLKDFLPLSVKLQSSYTYEVFSKHWKYHLQPSELQRQSLLWVLLKSFWPWLILGLILDVIYAFLLLVPPLILDGILEFVKDDTYKWRSYFFCASLFLGSFVSKTVVNNSLMYLLCASAQVKSALISAIFRKNLLLASSKRKNFSSGAISNLVSVDAERISAFGSDAAIYLISAPLRIILIIVVMWQYIGPSCLAGVAVIVLLIPLSFFFTKMSKKYLKRQMEITDIRLKYMNEILQGIKILKFYTWEIPFLLKISNTRKEEIKFVRLSQMAYVVAAIGYISTPILMAIASFTTFLLIDEKNILDPARAFVFLNLVVLLKFALFIVPDSLSKLIQALTSIDRIKTFLISEEIDPAVIGCNPDEGYVITVKNASLYWSEETTFQLKNIDINIPSESLIAVIGPVGSGKSSLLSTFLGEMYKKSGSIDIKGDLAYVPQEAWILNRSLKCNIILEKPVNEEVYNRILDCCCLRPDLRMLPAGDETEIGEKGINLSGGQKQRVSLARAIFQNRDIYLLDDPLSAVDAHVRKALIENVIGNEGLLKNKTRILVTHDISVLPYVDMIIRMEEGKILETGTYDELMTNSETFQNFIRTHSGQAEDDNLEEKIISRAAGDISGKLYDEAIDDVFTKPLDIKQSDATLIEEEKMEEGAVKQGIYLNYLKHTGLTMMLLALLCYLSYFGLEIGTNIWIADWSSDPILNGTHDHSRTVWRLSVYAGLGTVQGFIYIFAAAFMVYGVTIASETYHNRMLDCILKSPMSFFDVTPMGRIVNRFSTDINTLDIEMLDSIDNWIYGVLFAVSILLVIGMNIPIFLASVIPIGLLYYAFLKLNLNTSRQITRLRSTTRSPIYSHLLESICGVSCIRAFKVENEFIEKLEENLNNHIACVFNIYACNRWLNFWLYLIGSVIILIAAWLSIANRHDLGPSVVGLILNYALSVSSALIIIVRSNNALENKSVAIERIDEYCHLKSEAPWRKPDNDPAIAWPENGEIVFDNYSTRYRENLDLVLKDVNMNLHSNEKVGIVGRTGAGKSSITLALFRIIEPVQGTIFIDNIDLSKIGLHALRSKLTIIPQDPVLFTGSLRFNLDPNGEYNDDDIWKSLENSHLKDFVSGLSEGLEHNIEEGGKNLSAGQKQLLCLSRALLKKSKILVLDEATAAVDMDTDSLVQETIKTTFADHTVITIAHRLNTVLDYDKIIVMDTGSIIEVGNPGDLLHNKSSHFYKLARNAGLV